MEWEISRFFITVLQINKPTLTQKKEASCDLHFILEYQR